MTTPTPSASDLLARVESHRQQSADPRTIDYLADALRIVADLQAVVDGRPAPPKPTLPDCNCTGGCRGVEGLSARWRCSISKEPGRVVPVPVGSAAPPKPARYLAVTEEVARGLPETARVAWEFTSMAAARSNAADLNAGGGHGVVFGEGSGGPAVIDLVSLTAEQRAALTGGHHAPMRTDEEQRTLDATRLLLRAAEVKVADPTAQLATAIEDRDAHYREKCERSGAAAGESRRMHAAAVEAAREIDKLTADLAAARQERDEARKEVKVWTSRYGASPDLWLDGRLSSNERDIDRLSRERNEAQAELARLRAQVGEPVADAPHAPVGAGDLSRVYFDAAAKAPREAHEVGLLAVADESVKRYVVNEASKARLNGATLAARAEPPRVEVADPSVAEDRIALGNLLAVIHRDGGHHREVNGSTRSVSAAIDIVHALRAKAEATAAPAPGERARSGIEALVDAYGDAMIALREANDYNGDPDGVAEKARDAARARLLDAVGSTPGDPMDATPARRALREKERAQAAREVDAIAAPRTPPQAASEAARFVAVPAHEVNGRPAEWKRDEALARGYADQYNRDGGRGFHPTPTEAILPDCTHAVVDTQPEPPTGPTKPAEDEVWRWITLNDDGSPGALWESRPPWTGDPEKLFPVYRTVTAPSAPSLPGVDPAKVEALAAKWDRDAASWSNALGNLIRRCADDLRAIVATAPVRVLDIGNLGATLRRVCRDRGMAPGWPGDGVLREVFAALTAAGPVAVGERTVTMEEVGMAVPGSWKQGPYGRSIDDNVRRALVPFVGARIVDGGGK